MPALSEYRRALLFERFLTGKPVSFLTVLASRITREAIRITPAAFPYHKSAFRITRTAFLYRYGRRIR